MSKFACKCGNVISNVSSTASDGIMLSEDSLGQCLEKVRNFVDDFRHADQEGRRTNWLAEYFSEIYPADASDSEVIEDALSEFVRDLSLDVIRCDTCGRIHVQKEAGLNKYVSYVREI